MMNIIAICLACLFFPAISAITIVVIMAKKKKPASTAIEPAGETPAPAVPAGATPATPPVKTAPKFNWFDGLVVIALIVFILACVTSISNGCAGTEKTVTPTVTPAIAIDDETRHTEVVTAPVGKWSPVLEIPENSLWDMDCKKGESFDWLNSGHKHRSVGGSKTKDHGKETGNKFQFMAVGDKEVTVIFLWKKK